MDGVDKLWKYKFFIHRDCWFHNIYATIYNALMKLHIKCHPEGGTTEDLVLSPARSFAIAQDDNCVKSLSYYI